MSSASFGSPVRNVDTKQRKHPLAGDGPIVDRARHALRYTAAQFGEVVRHDQTTATVRTADGITLTLSYDPGNFIFSRVYAFTISVMLPAESHAPSGVKLVHRGSQRGGTFVRDRRGAPATDGSADAALLQLNKLAAAHFAEIDTVRATITATANGQRRFTLSPMGGAYVWVLIPPVFKSTAFPPGEPERIIEFIRELRELSFDSVTAA